MTGLFAVLVCATSLAVALALCLEVLLSLAGLRLVESTWAPSWLKALPPFQGVLAEIMACSLVLFPLCLVPSWRLGPTLVSRYDNEALRVPPVPGVQAARSGPVREQQAVAWARLHDWCFAGAGTGRSPWWGPWLRPDIGTLVSVATLTEAAGAGTSALAAAFSRHLDGTDLLESLAGRSAGMRYRLGVKIKDVQWWRARQEADPWDCGYLVNQAGVHEGLKHFLPRRATLIVAEQLSGEVLQAFVMTIAARQGEFRHPVRVLIIGPALPAGWMPVERGEQRRTPGELSLVTLNIPHG